MGEGAFGEVRFCHHKITGEARAVKLIQKGKLTAEKKVAIFNEFEILKSLDHPNIVCLYEFYDEPNFYCIV